MTFIDYNLSLICEHFINMINLKLVLNRFNVSFKVLESRTNKLEVFVSIIRLEKVIFKYLGFNLELKRLFIH